MATQFPRVKQIASYSKDNIGLLVNHVHGANLLNLYN